jgi:hypothetical protein
MPAEAAPARSSPRRSVGSAVGRLLAVFDRAAEADAATEGLVAAAIDRDLIERFDDPPDAAAFDSSGRRHGLLGRIYRLVELSWADQAPDFAWYEAAVRDGRIVLSVPVRGQGRVAEVGAIVAAHGGHFVNHYGWFETQELVRWRGEEPVVPRFFKR